MPITTCSITPEDSAKLTHLFQISGVAKHRILAALIRREHAEVTAGKTPTYGTRAAGDGGRDG